MEHWNLLDEYDTRKYLTTSKRQDYYNVMDQSLLSNKLKARNVILPMTTETISEV